MGHAMLAGSSLRNLQLWKHLQSGLELLSIPAVTGKAKMNGFSVFRLFFLLLFESDVAGVKIWCRIYTINVRISTAPKSLQICKPTYINKVYNALLSLQRSWWYLGSLVVVSLFVICCCLCRYPPLFQTLNQGVHVDGELEGQKPSSKQSRSWAVSFSTEAEPPEVSSAAR